MSNTHRALRTAALFAVPFLVWLLLRYFIRETLQFDHGLLVPSVALFAIVAWTTSEPLRPRYPTLLLDLILLAGALLVATRPDGVFDMNRLIALELLAGTALLTALFIWIRPSDWLRAAFLDPVRTGFCIAGLFLYRIFVPCREFLWPYLSGPSTHLVRMLLESLGLTFLPSGPDRIEHENLKIFIAPACSGLEGVFLFGSMFSMLMALDYRKFGAGRIAAAYAAGALWMLALNILRIAAIVLVAIRTTDPNDPSTSARLAGELFHLNVGWMLYLTGALAYVAAFYGLFRYLRKPNPQSERFI